MSVNVNAVVFDVDVRAVPFSSVRNDNGKADPLSTIANSFPASSNPLIGSLFPVCVYATSAIVAILSPFETKPSAAAVLELLSNVVVRPLFVYNWKAVELTV